MAIVVTTIDSGQGDTGGGSTFNTASLSSGTGVTRLVSIRTYGASGVTSITGDGLTYTQIASSTNPADGGVDGWLWRGTGNPTAGALTVTLAGGTGLSYSYAVESVAGAHASTPIVQSATATGTGTTASVTLSGFASATNGAYAMCGLASNQSFTPGTGFTELNDFAGIFATYRHFTEWRADADTSVDATIAASADWDMIAIEIAEAAAGGTVNTNTLTDTVAIADEPLDYVFANRLGSDDVVVVDSPTESFSIHNIAAISETVVTDDFLAWLRRHRVLDDSVTVTDELISTIVGYLIYTSVLTSNVSVTDGALQTAYFYRLVDSGIVTEDQLLRAVLVARDLLDSVEVSDSGLTAIQRFILLTDTISLEDSLSALYVPAALDNPVIRIGFDQPKIQLGGYSVN